jgi:hypothetical protein
MKRKTRLINLAQSANSGNPMSTPAQSLQEIAEKWRKAFIEACPPFVPEEQKQPYEILLDGYITSACEEGYKLGHDDIFEGMDAENQQLRQQLEQAEAE